MQCLPKTALQSTALPGAASTVEGLCFHHAGMLCPHTGWLHARSCNIASSPELQHHALHLPVMHDATAVHAFNSVSCNAQETMGPCAVSRAGNCFVVQGARHHHWMPPEIVLRRHAKMGLRV